MLAYVGERAGAEGERREKPRFGSPNVKNIRFKHPQLAGIFELQADRVASGQFDLETEYLHITHRIAGGRCRQRPQAEITALSASTPRSKRMTGTHPLFSHAMYRISQTVVYRTISQSHLYVVHLADG